MKVAFVDTETLGLNVHRHPIWEIAVITPDHPEGGEHVWQVKVSPAAWADVEEVALDINHFHDRYDPDTALSPLDTVERLFGLLWGRHIVGAVPSFDEERIRYMFDQATAVGASVRRDDGRYPWHYHVIDVEAMAVGYLNAEAAATGAPPVVPPYKSDRLGDLLGVEPVEPAERHTALGDARWVRRMYERMTGGGR